MSSIGGVLFDRDATYIDLGGSHHLGGGRLTSGRQVIVGANEAELTKARDLFSTAGHGLDERLEHDHRVQILADAPLLEPFPNVVDEALSTDSGDDVVDDEVDNSEESNEESLRMFEDTSLPGPANKTANEVDYTKNGQKNWLNAKANAQFDYQHRDLKEAFDSR